MSDNQATSVGSIALTSLWLATASKERITASFGSTITEGLDSAGSAAVVVVSTRLPRIRMSSVMARLVETATCPVVVLCHAGGEITARDLLQLGATHLVAEGNEATIAGLVDAGPGTPAVGEDGIEIKQKAPDVEPLLTGFAFEMENQKRAGSGDGVDPVTLLPSDSAFSSRFGELTQRESLPRVGFIRIANTDAALGHLDRPTLDLVRRRLVLQFRNLIAEKSVELFMIDGLELAIISTVLTASQMSRLADDLVRAAESFAPSGGDPIRLAIGHAGPEVANEARTLRELAASATAAAVALGGGVVSGDELALSRANATEHEAAIELGSWIDERDRHGGDHSLRVAELAVAIGRELGVDGLDLIRLRLAARLHDIGKIHLPVELMGADPATLSGDDLTKYQDHARIGANFLALSVNEEVGEAVKQHHETWDGSGYPDGIASDDITFSARVIAMADHLDASSRGSEQTADELIESLEAASGTTHDPSVVWATQTLLRTGDLDHILFA